MSVRDQKRRVAIAIIFAEGCFKTANDYAAAAMIYQHGDVPDHYYQAFIWSSRAVALGDEKQNHMMALTIDRYLVSIGKKQWFGSQVFASDANGWCFCMLPVEASFPDSMRQRYLGQSLADQYAWLSSLNRGKYDCIQSECPDVLESSPEGTLPGFW